MQRIVERMLLLYNVSDILRPEFSAAACVRMMPLLISTAVVASHIILSSFRLWQLCRGQTFQGPGFGLGGWVGEWGAKHTCKCIMYVQNIHKRV